MPRKFNKKLAGLLLITISFLFVGGLFFRVPKTQAAITLIGTPQSAVANNGGTATITWSVTPSEGDYTVVIIGSPANSAAYGTMVTAGYGSPVAFHAGAAAANPSLAVYIKKQGASPDTTAAAISANGGSTDTTMLGYVLRGVDPDNPLDQTTTYAGETVSTNPDPAQIVTQTDGALVLVAAAMTVTMDTSPGTISGYTDHLQNTGNDTNDHTLATAYKITGTAGTEDPGAWSTWSSGRWYAATVAFKAYVPVTTVSGGCFTDATEGTACADDGSNQIKVAVNGVLQSGADTVVDGSWSVNLDSQPASGATIVVYIDGEATETEEATTVTKYDGSDNIDGVKLYQNQLVIGTDTGSANSDQTVANTDMDTDGGSNNGYENSDDEDVLVTISAGNDLTLQSGAHLYVISGDTYQPGSAGGADATVQNLYFEGTLTTDSNTVNVAGDYTNAGTLTASTSTFTFNGNVAQTITTNSQEFNVVTLNNTGTDGANDNITISGTLDIDGNFNITNGDLVLSTNNPNVFTGADLTIGSSAFVTKGSGTWTFEYNGTNTWTDNTSGQDLGSVIIGTTGKTINLGSSVMATSVTIPTSQTLGLGSSGYTLTLTGSGTAASRPFIVVGTLNEGTNSTVKFTGTTATDVAAETFWNLDLSPSGGSNPTYTLGLSGTDSNGTAYKIDDASNFGPLPGSGRQLLRTSSGELYAVVNDGTSVEIWDSGDGSSWTQQDAGDAPAGDQADGTSAAMDSSNVVHVVYASGGDLRYVTFDTVTHQYGTPANIVSDANFNIVGHDIALDGNGKPHVVFSYNTISPTKYYLHYSNKVGANWKTSVEIHQDNTSPYTSSSITVNASEVPVIAYVATVTTALDVELGDQNDAATFTEATPDTTVATANTSVNVAFDTAGNAWVSYVDATTNYASLARHDSASGWTTGWTTHTNSNVGVEPSLALVGTKTYLFYTDDQSDIVYDVYDGSWLGETVLASGTYQDVKTKWAYNFNSRGSIKIDYLYSDNTDVYWNNLSLGADAAGTITANNFNVGDGSNAVTVTANTNDPAVDANGNFSIAASGTFTASDSNTFAVGGNWSNAGTFNHSSGTVDFNAGATGKTIDSGGITAAKTFFNVHFENSAGGWTIQTSDMKVAGSLNIVDVSAWALEANRTLEVNGMYVIADAETAATTWNVGSTLYLNSGNHYTVGSKTQSAETYANLQIGVNADIHMWQSSASGTVTVDATGSLASHDHANADGDLYLWGDYNIDSAAYWSYATDFDGTDLSGGSERPVDVRIDPAAIVTVETGITLAIIGTSINHTTVSRQGASNGYELVCDGGTINISYADFDYLDGPAGLDIRAGSIITDINNTTFENLVGTAGTDANLTVATSVIGTGNRTFTGITFTLNAGDKNAAVIGTDVTGYWTFSGTDGEADDWNNTTVADEANPGMLRWNDSSTGGIIISGTTNLGDGIIVKVAVGGSIQGSGAVAGGLWEVMGVSPSADDLVIIFVTDGDDDIADGSESTTVSKYSGTGDLTGLPLSSNVLSIGGTGDQSISLADLISANYDWDQDEDIMFDAESGSLLVDGGNNYTAEKINILSSDTFTLSNSATLTTFDLEINGTLTSGTGTSYSVSGSWNNANVFTASTSTVTFTDTVGSKTLDGNLNGSNRFNNLIFNGLGGGWSVDSPLDVFGDFTLTAGAVTQGSGNDIVLYGNVTLANGTTYTKDATGILILEGDAGTEYFEDLNGTKQDMGNVQIGISPGVTSLKSDTSVTSLTIGTTDTYNTRGWDVTISGDFTCSGSCTLNTSDGSGTNYEGDGTVITTGGNWTMSGTGTFTLDTDNTTYPGVTTNIFNASATGKTINAGGSGTPFYDVQFNHSAGGWTIQTTDMKVNRNLTITDVSDWTLAASRTLEVNGTYSIADAETAATTFSSGSVLYLNSATAYTVGSKSQSKEVYATLQIGANTDIRTWNSLAATHTVNASGSLYSQDHENIDGNLYIWGDYHALTNDYWSWATDFDGTSLSGSERRVNVQIDNTSTVTAEAGDTLAIIGGTSPNRTAVTRQGNSGGYVLNVQDTATINFQYADFYDLEGAGINITGGTVTSLSYCKFNYHTGGGATDAFITIAASVIGTGTPSLTITGAQFDNDGTGADYNVYRSGTNTGYWLFADATGSYDGESNDFDSTDPGMIQWTSIDTNGHRSIIDGTVEFEGSATFM